MYMCVYSYLSIYLCSDESIKGSSHGWDHVKFLNVGFQGKSSFFVGKIGAHHLPVMVQLSNLCTCKTYPSK